MAKVEHFEIPADDPERAQRFYRAVLGYEYEPWDDDNGMIRSADGGIEGDIHRRTVLPHPTVVFTVDDIEQTLREAVAHGGEQIGEIERMGEDARWVYLRDTEGNVVGLYDER